MVFLIATNTLIFLGLSAIHIYWAMGGRWAFDTALPTKPDGQFLFKPSALSTLLVAIGLFMFALITLGNYGLFDHWIDRKYIQFGMWTISFVFVLRAIGDFKFTGFTKKNKHTQFADRDTKIYSPLCLGVAVISFLIASFS